MANLELDVLRGIVRKTLYIGIIACVGAGWYSGAALALAVGVGGVVAALNLLFVAWLSKKVIDASKEGWIGKSGWMVLSVLKMTLLFGLVWYLIARLQLDAIGFALGFSSFLPAIVWQAISTQDVDTSDPSA